MRRTGSRARSHSPFCHGDLVLDDGTLLGSSNNPGAPVITGNPSGGRHPPLGLPKIYLRLNARIEATPEQKAAFEQFCHDQLGKPFDSEALRFRTFLSGDFPTAIGAGRPPGTAGK